MARKRTLKRSRTLLKSALRESAAQIKRGKVSSIAALRAIYRSRRNG